MKCWSAGRLAILFALFAVTGGDAAGAVDLEAARAAQAERRWAEAESLATAALNALDVTPAADSLDVAEALYLIGSTHYRRHGYADGVGIAAAARALGLFRRGLGENASRTADAHALLGTYLAGTDRSDSALVHMQRALAIRTRVLSPDDTVLADTWDQIALFHRNESRFRAAIDAWEEAIDVRRRRGGEEDSEAALFLAQTGICWAELGDLPRAREVLERSLAILARSAPDHPRRWIPLNLLSDVVGREGDLGYSADLLREGLRVLEGSSNPRPALTLRGNLAGDLLGLGDYAGARAIYASLIPDVTAQFGPSHFRTLWIRLGFAMASQAVGDYETALATVAAVEDSFAARGRAFERFRSEGQLVRARILHEQGRHREAALMGERSIETELSLPHPEPLALANAFNIIVWSLASLDDLAALDSVRTRMDRHMPAEAQAAKRSFMLYACARADRALGRTETAWQEALLADSLQHEVTRLSLQRLPDRRALELTRKEARHLDVVLDLARRGPASWNPIAWDRLVRTRGMVRAEAARRRLPALLEDDAGAAEAHARLLVARRDLAQKLVTSSARDSAAHAALERLHREVDAAEGAYAEMLVRAGLVRTIENPGLGDVLERLAPGEALVAFAEITGFIRTWLSDEEERDTSRVVAFIARGGTDAIVRVDLPRSIPLTRAIDRWRAALATSPGPGSRPGDRAERACRALGAEVRALAWDPIAPHVRGARDVYLVGDGPVLDLPWSALPGEGTAYLVEDGPRLHVLHAERELLEPGLEATGAGAMLAIGAPDFERMRRSEEPLVAALVRAAPDPCAAGGRAALGPLPGTGLEAGDVARIWRERVRGDAVVLRGAEADEAAFKAHASGRRILHLATHGLVAEDTCRVDPAGTRGVGRVEPSRPKGGRPARPAASAALAKPPAPSPWAARRVWLALAGANQAHAHRADENEGLLTAEEVLSLDLEGTEWVVLSACHSGIGEVWTHEGALGMRRAFDLAGARTVIASQWAVEDEATREWMTALYEARADGAADAAAAMEAASRSVLDARRRAKRSTHPFYWAAFTASGR